MKSMAEIFLSYSERDATGRHVGGTDKNSNHNYGSSYESLFPDRDAVELVLEVGIAGGHSMLAWREIFQRATIVGMDIHPCSCERGPRLEFHVGDQRSHADCMRAVNGRQFDFIVEDATHVLENNLLTMFYLWPFVKPGGVYVVEEFANIGSWRENIKLFRGAELLDTMGPFGGNEPLLVVRKE